MHFSILILSLLLAFGSGTAQYTAASYANTGPTSDSTSNGQSTSIPTTGNPKSGEQVGSSVRSTMNRGAITTNSGQQHSTSGSSQRSGMSGNQNQGVPTSQNGQRSSTSSSNSQGNMASNMNGSAMKSTQNHNTSTSEKMKKQDLSGKRCHEARVTVDNCDQRSGIFFKINDKRWEELNLYQIGTPTSVPAKMHLIVAICNFGNSGGNRAPSQPIIPTLFGDVGEYSVVSVHIYNSANFAVKGNLDFSLNNRHLKPTLISPIVNGTIHKSASIFVKITKSGNIALVKDEKDPNSFHMKGSTLIAGVIHTVEKEKCLKSLCIDVEIQESANIVTMGQDSNAEIRNATLLGTPVLYKCMDGGSQHVYVNSSANVVHLEKLSMEEESSLLAPTVRSYEIKEGNVFVSIENTANVIVKDKFSMKSSVLAHASINVKEAMKSIVTAFMENSGNLLGKMAHLGGEPNIIGLVDLEKAEKDVKIVATVITSGLMFATKLIEDAICIKNVVQVSKEAKDVEIYVELVESCDIFSEHATIPENKALLKSLISTGECEKCILKGDMSKSANTLVKKSLFIKSYASLIAKLVDIREAKEDVEVLLEGGYSCSVHCNGGYSGLDLGKDSHLIGTVLSVKGKGVRAKMLGKQLGNAYVPIKGDGSLVGKGVDTEKAVSSLYAISNLVGMKLKCPVAHNKY